MMILNSNMALAYSIVMLLALRDRVLNNRRGLQCGDGNIFTRAKIIVGITIS